MKLNIDLHILKEIITLQAQKEKAVKKANEYWTIMRECDSKMKALIEFIEGEVDKNDKKDI